MKNQRTIILTMAFFLTALGVVACGKNSTPTKAYQTFYEAVKNKDIKAFKSVMSKEALVRGERSAKAENKTIDDLIKKDLEMMTKTPYTLETRNETIASDGRTATIEFKDDKEVTHDDSWQEIPFVKEDDGWKIANMGL